MQSHNTLPAYHYHPLSNILTRFQFWALKTAPILQSVLAARFAELVVAALAFAFIGYATPAIAHDVRGISQAEYNGAFYEGCRRQASAKYCQCVQDQYGTHLKSRAELIAAMLGTGPRVATMMRHASSFCRDGKSSVAMDSNPQQTDRNRVEREERRRSVKAQSVQRRTALIVKHLGRKSTLQGLLMDQRRGWRFDLRIQTFSEAKQTFTGRISWRKKDVSHPIAGSYSGAKIEFEEVGKPGSSQPSNPCTYFATVYNSPRDLKGKWTCPFGKGNVALYFPKK